MEILARLATSRWVRWGLVLAWMASIFVVSAQPDLARHPDRALDVVLKKLAHMIEYGVLAVFTYEALTERASRGRRVPSPALLAIAVTAAVGVLDEIIQALVPSRVFDPRDMLFNVLAAVMAVAASAALGWARRRFRNRMAGPSGDAGEEPISTP